MYETTRDLDEILEFTRDNPVTANKSCLIADELASRPLLEEDLDLEVTDYVLIDDPETDGGYARIIDLSEGAQRYFFGRVGALDILFTDDNDVKDREIIQALVESATALGYDHLIVPTTLLWVRDTFPRASSYEVYLEIPELNFSRYFANGTDHYQVIDLAEQYAEQAGDKSLREYIADHESRYDPRAYPGSSPRQHRERIVVGGFADMVFASLDEDF